MHSFPATRAISALVIREIATTYGRTPGGFLWAILEPVAAVAVLATIFSFAFDAPPLGRSFALFYASGYLPFAFFTDLAQKIGVSLRYSRPFMAYPAITWLDALIARFLLNSVAQLLVIGVVLTTMLAMAGVAPANPPAIALALAMAASLGLCLGTLNAYLFERWPVWERVWAILTRPAFLLSGVLFLPDAVPPPYRDWLWLNPLTHVITAMRSGLFEGYDPPGWMPLYPCTIALIILPVGLLLLRRDARDLLWRN